MFETGFRTVNLSAYNGSILVLWSFHEPVNAEVSDKKDTLPVNYIQCFHIV